MTGCAYSSAPPPPLPRQEEGGEEKIEEEGVRRPAPVPVLVQFCERSPRSLQNRTCVAFDGD